MSIKSRAFITLIMCSVIIYAGVNIYYIAMQILNIKIK